MASAATAGLRKPKLERSAATVVKAQDDPKRGSIPELIYAQRDGGIAKIYVKVGDDFKAGDRLLDFGASPQAVVTYKQAQSTVTLKKQLWSESSSCSSSSWRPVTMSRTRKKDLSGAEASVRMLEEIGSLKDSEILTAPFDGGVTAISVKTGDRILAGALLMILSSS